MALEAVVYPMPQEHFGYPAAYGLPWCGEEPCGEWDPSLLASLVQNVGDLEVEGCSKGASPETFARSSPPPTAKRRKRRRIKTAKGEEEIESQRMTHIAVERNRRRQMNEYLAVLRSVMPASYSQRGDQASIVGGAINYVRELEQLLQSLEVHKGRKDQSGSGEGAPRQSPFADFFTFPQYSTSDGGGGDDAGKIEAGTPTAAGSSSRPAAVADVEVSMVEGHATVRVQAPRRPRQLLRLAAGLQRLGLATLHLNMTSANAMVMYSFSLEVGDECKIGSVEEIATAVHEILGRIQQEAATVGDTNIACALYTCTARLSAFASSHVSCDSCM